MRGEARAKFLEKPKSVILTVPSCEERDYKGSHALSFKYYKGWPSNHKGLPSLPSNITREVTHHVLHQARDDHRRDALCLHVAAATEVVQRRKAVGLHEVVQLLVGVAAEVVQRLHGRRARLRVAVLREENEGLQQVRVDRDEVALVAREGLPPQKLEC